MCLSLLIAAAYSSPVFSADRFIAHVDTFVYAPGPGMVTYYNISSNWMYDATTNRSRMDTMMWEKGYSSAPGFEFSVSRTVYSADKNTYSALIGELGETPTCSSTPTSQDTFPGSAAVGSMGYLLPPDKQWLDSGEDIYLGDEILEGTDTECSVWGWNGIYGGYHRVYVFNSTGQALKETQKIDSPSYPAEVVATFSYDVAIDEYFFTKEGDSVFAAPPGC